MMKCPKCGDECWQDSVDVGVGVMYGPWGCPTCAWSEDEKYDFSGDRDPIDEKGGYTDQFGAYYPPGNPTAIIFRGSRANKK